MPEISRFFGIVIKMFFDDHNPPHFHAEYGGDLALIAWCLYHFTFRCQAFLLLPQGNVIVGLTLLNPF